MKIEQWISSWGIFNSKLNKENEMAEMTQEGAEMTQEEYDASREVTVNEADRMSMELEETKGQFDFLSKRVDAAVRVNDFKDALILQKQLILLLGPIWKLEYEIRKLKQELENGSN